MQSLLEQAARALRDQELLGALRRIQEQNVRQRTFLMTRIKQASPQTLVVPS